MTETTTRIDDAYGPTHTGAGPQHNHYYPGGLSEDSKGRTPRVIAEAELRWLRKRFVEPEGFADALATLEQHHLVLLDGTPGDGRTATARVLLQKLAPAGHTMHELLLEKDDADSSRLLDPELIEDEGRLLLDLSDKDDRWWRTVQAELSAFRAALPGRRAALVVVLPHKVQSLVASERSELYQEIARAPDQELDIIKKHMRAGRLDPTSADSGSPALTEFLERRPRPALSELGRFSQYVCRAAGEDPRLPFATWCTRALVALDGQSEEAKFRLRDTTKGASRALLVATAMLHEARSDAVHRAAALLHTAVDPELRTRHALRHRPLTERLDDIEADVDAETRVRFRVFELDAAVRTRVWHDFPDLRDALRDWVGEILKLTELEEPEREALVERFATECLACRRPDDLLTLSRRWTRTSDEPQLLAAARALRHGLKNREFGRLFRGNIYDWALDWRLSPAQRRVLVDVCLGEMAVRHPYQALVRLHHLARRERTTHHARDALAELLKNDHRLRRRMLNRLTSTSPSHLDADTALFLSLSEPGPLGAPGSRSQPLIAESAVQRDLITGWARVFRDLPVERWTPGVHTWLDAARGELWDGDAFLHVLVKACEGRGDRLGLLNLARRRWAVAQPPGDGRAAVLAGQLLGMIGDAQRARTTGARRASTRETTEASAP
ncbi:nSTAND3 domain-containing NTPase [Streptomyces corynorhini]|uniref:Novel STAND NTPase 3 domain-containing protein n=1 Tax=Streptomyces corynorhini TaxID=2282652 RepID=A0A370BJ98_9ACTN|nr:hypothetical protein [Streptomyces corynorhini]RDG39843.1 hypothetical protein DVH02_01655 [Streptomyces corynorhini]